MKNDDKLHPQITVPLTPEGIKGIDARLAELPEPMPALDGFGTQPVDNNPKARLGALKAPLHLVPPSVKIALSEALADGATKYGAYNWRDEPISVSTYKGGLERHMDAYWDGEEFAEDSGVHHLYHALANIALMIDARSVGTLVDDRPTAGAASRMQADYHGKQTLKADDFIETCVKGSEHVSIEPTDTDKRLFTSCAPEDNVNVDDEPNHVASYSCHEGED